MIFFQVTEDNLKEYFSQYGEIDEINILTKPDGKRTGVAFVQFNIVQSAAKAIHYANMKSFLDRPMIVDWAIPKNQFSQNNMDLKPEIKIETIDEDDTTEIKLENEIENDSNAKIDRYIIKRLILSQIFLIILIIIFFCIIKDFIIL